ncbi:MAG: DinB superfamily protein [Flavobacterium sp. BFFFF2]|nr:MAG: DinB superfamily protein [Flavobacterium sp. BFFFF2]
MLTTTLISLFERDLNRVIHELNQYQTEMNIWRIEKNISNSAGNLTLHLIGNLSTYIGKEIGKTDYIRNRPLEFSETNVSRDELIDKLNQTIIVIKNALTHMTDGDLSKEYPVLVFSEMTSTDYLLVHLTTHLAYHLGQINYHRRLIDN